MVLSKAEVRACMRTRLRLPAGERQAKSALICRAIAAHPAYRTAETVALFDAMPSEPALDELWRLQPKRFLFPRVEGAELRLVEVTALHHLPAPAFRGGYREPPPGEEAVPQVVLVPGLAFTRDGARLGRGGGYYDRLLARLPADVTRLGVCFAMQIVPELPLEPHDFRLQGVLTEE